MFRMFEVPNNRDMKVDKWSGSGRGSSKPNKPNNRPGSPPLLGTHAREFLPAQSKGQVDEMRQIYMHPCRMAASMHRCVLTRLASRQASVQ